MLVENYICFKKNRKRLNEVISIFYPINNTLSGNQKNKNNFDINENILKLNKKE